MIFLITSEMASGSHDLDNYECSMHMTNVDSAVLIHDPQNDLDLLHFQISRK